MKSIFRSTPRSRRLRQSPAPESQEESQSFFTHAETSDGRQTAQPFFQAKLTVGQPDDPYEREADAVADRVVSGNTDSTPAVQSKEISTVQRLATPNEEKMPGTNDARMEEDRAIQEKPEAGVKEEEMPVQKMGAPEEEEKPLQKMETPEEEKDGAIQSKSEPGHTARKAPLSSRLSQSRGKGEPLPTPVRARMEQGIGADFSGVRIHRDSDSVDMNKELHAQAFTHGQDVYFNSGKFNPEDTEGKRLLAHELTHVVQQGATQKKIQKLPGAPVLTSHQTKTAIKWYKNNNSRYTPDLISKIQEATGIPQSGIMDEASVQAVADWQLMNKVDADGIAGPRTLPAMFPSGLAEGKSQTIFAVEGLLEEWNNLAIAADRAKAVMKIMNEHLKLANVPECGHTLLDLKGDWGQFDFATWSISLDNALFSKAVLTNDDITNMMTTIYHEARHAEQWYRMAQMRAGEGASAATISGAMGIQEKIAQEAFKNPILKGSMEALVAKGWDDSVYGSKSAHREAVLKDIEVKGSALEKAKKNYNDNPTDANMKKWQKAYDAFEKAHKKYKNLPEEHDAWHTADSLKSTIDFFQAVKDAIK